MKKERKKEERKKMKKEFGNEKKEYVEGMIKRIVNKVSKIEIRKDVRDMGMKIEWMKWEN